MKPLILLLAATALLVPAAGCGKKGPPAPPQREQLPPPVDDLAATVDAGVVELTWTVPATTDRHPLPAESFRVLLHKRSLADDCVDCPPTFKLAGELEVLGRPGKQSAGAQLMRYRYSLEDGYRYSFRVVPVGREGSRGPVSDTVTVER